jgi:predicted PurR-regulated permease PerM
MAAQTSGVADERHEPHRPRTNWTRLRDIPLAILAWILVIAVVLWAASHVIGTLLVLAIAGLLAFALYPIINWLSRGMPRPLAMALVYVVFFALIGLLVYFIVDTAVQQLVTVAGRLEQLVKTGPHAQTSPLYDFAHQLGLSDQQLQQISGFLVEQAQGIAGGILPILSGIANLVINLVVVTVLSIYLIPNGPRVNHWLRTGVPLSFRARASFLMDTLDRVVGGYIRGQFTLATLIGVLVGIGMFIFQVPFAILLGVMAFVLEFIPFLGVIISGAACVLIALTQGWLTALLVLGWFVVMHIIEGDVVGPRIRRPGCFRDAEEHHRACATRFRRPTATRRQRANTRSRAGCRRRLLASSRQCADCSCCGASSSLLHPQCSDQLRAGVLPQPLVVRWYASCIASPD